MTSILKVDNIQTQSGKTIISETSNVVTVGQVGDTVVNSGTTTVKGDGSSQDGKIILNCSLIKARKIFLKLNLDF